MSAGVPFIQTGQATRTQSRPQGLAAMRALLERHRVVDNFRHLHRRREEYTRNHTKHGITLSQKRLDRIYSSAALHRDGSLPRVIRTEHVWPDQTDMAVLRYEGSSTKWSDHAAVTSTLRYTGIERPEMPWTMPLHMLDELKTVEAMRTRAEGAEKSAGERPLEALFNLIDSSKDFAKIQAKEATKAHRKKKQTIINQLRACDKLLGTNRAHAEIDEIEHQPTRELRRATVVQQRAEADAAMRALVQKEQERWIRHLRACGTQSSASSTRKRATGST